MGRDKGYTTVRELLWTWFGDTESSKNSMKKHFDHFLHFLLQSEAVSPV